MPNRKVEDSVKNENVDSEVEKKDVNKEESEEALFYRTLVYKIKGAKNQAEVNDAFRKISDGLEIKIKKIAGKFKIPGFSFDDIYQECLYALQYKAIKDYDETRGSIVGMPAMFDRFALLCIRRHLATTLKTAHQNRKRILNESKSLDQDRSNGDDDLSLINIVQSKDSPILDGMEVREFIRSFTKKLLSKLSTFEQEVFVLYVQKYSYEEIADQVIGDVEQIAVKAIDNGLSRIKHKGWEIYEKMVNQEQVPSVAIKWYEEEQEKRVKEKHLAKKKKKRR